MAATKDKPTIVLVHGAFADGSSWSGVVGLLQTAGLRGRRARDPVARRHVRHRVRRRRRRPDRRAGAARRPLVRRRCDQQRRHRREERDRPRLRRGVRAGQGRAPRRRHADSKDAILGPALVQQTYPTGDGQTAVEFVVDPAQFRAAFCADLPEAQAAVMAATQRPVAAAGFSDPSGPPAWGSLPSWAVVATGDKAAGADLVRSMAERAGAADRRGRRLARRHGQPAAGGRRRHRHGPPRPPWPPRGSRR